MVPPLVARDVEADPGFMLFYYALKYTEEGKINFTKVASSMCLDTAGAASKRYKRLIEVQDAAEGRNKGSIGNTVVQDGNTGALKLKPKPPPKKGRGKRIAAGTEHENCDWERDKIGDEEPSPAKKQRVADGKSKAGGKNGKSKMKVVEEDGVAMANMKKAIAKASKAKEGDGDA